MLVRIKLYDTLRRFSNTDDKSIWQGEIPEGTQISELLEIMGIQPGEVGNAAINKVVVSTHTTIQVGDAVALVTNINGG